ncbi:TPA: hypothetical protein QCI16_002857 [Enterobacter ludwigii]|uniref:hypothetical protein n=1 Tax=Enterobacter ludwigii TaxID=299767 RepID=UPI00330437E9|nr:hypothetical protein [Enterobacter ludwigii]HDR2591122.1 hypothetical protein [Enterobacter ludwigii]HDR2598683.1 hypothetical protein [Enterobacter ludwigii]
MSYPNIEKFNEIVGRVFARLYVNFPATTKLTTDFLVGEGKGIFEVIPGVNDLDDEGKFAFASVDWLINAGYISAKKNEQTFEFAASVLTAKGLESLKQTPASLNASFGEQIDAAIKNGSTDALRSLASRTLTYGLSVILGLSQISHH